MFISFVVTTRKSPNYVCPVANLNWQAFTIVFHGDLRLIHSSYFLNLGRVTIVSTLK